jgi:2-polyprenyl-3-methyl-5-hydroxy-6-metoxy-1,4-benzoquinol methylase
MRDHNSEFQDNEGRKYAYDFDTVVRRYLLRAIGPHLQAGGRTLELGCFRGDMTAQILELVPSLTVVEAASELAGLVSARFPGRVRIVVSTFEDAQLDERYDNVFLVHTLEHLDDPVGVLRRIGGWLAPGGHLFVAVPNANALSRQIAVRMGLVESNAAVTPAERAHGHRRTYSEDVLLQDVRSAGLQVRAHGGVVVKALANFQFDRALQAGIIDERYLDACDELARSYPDLSASLYVVCSTAGP